AAQRSNDLLTPKVAAEIFSPHVEAFQGFGVALKGEGESARFEHGGWDEGFVSNFVAYQHHGIGAVMMANADQGGAEIEPEILRSIAKEYSWPGYQPATPKIIDLTDAELRSVVGTYEINPSVHLVIKGEGRRVFLAADQQSPIEIVFTSTSKAFSKSVNTEVAFTKEAGGIVTGLKLTEGQREFTARKLA
ncbi:MAG: hypothetical protein JO185_11585, partial [Acidobacteriaceae bacterium]|nr:hypothetical protein [Acidobacteriaceae bacterium]